MMSVRRLMTPLSTSLELLESDTSLWNDDLINCFMRIVERRNYYHSQTLPSIFVYDTFFFENWKRKRLSSVNCQTKTVNLFEREMILFPLHLPEHGPDGHWALIVAVIKEATITSYDSCGWSHPAAATAVQNFLDGEAKRREVSGKLKWQIMPTSATIPLQKNSADCGAFVCAYAEALTRRLDIKGKVFCGRKIRKTIRHALRRGRIGIEEFQLWEPDPLHNYLSVEARGWPSKEEQPGSIPIKVAVPNGEKLDIVVHWDPVLEQLSRDAESGYKGDGGYSLFPTDGENVSWGDEENTHPRGVPEGQEDDYLLDLINDALQEFTPSTDGQPLACSNKDLEDQAECEMDELAEEFMGLGSQTRTEERENKDEPADEPMEVGYESPVSPCLSLTASDTWEKIEERDTVTSETGEEGTVEKWESVKVESEVERKRRAEGNGGQDTNAPAKKKKKKHPKRIRIWDAEGKMRRINERYLPKDGKREKRKEKMVEPENLEGVCGE